MRPVDPTEWSETRLVRNSVEEQSPGRKGTKRQLPLLFVVYIGYIRNSGSCFNEENTSEGG